MQDPTTHLITDLVSFYSLPSTIMKHKQHNLLNAAYMFYYASDVISQPSGSADGAAAHDAKSKQKLSDRLNALVADLLVVAKNVSYVALG
jgi:glycylpeptide N-tetradecanoyltransferase